MWTIIASIFIGQSLAMDFGGGGVWDSPMATDQYVKQFGWLFGGGWSGVQGMKAQTSSKVSKADMKLSSPYKYEVDTKNSVDIFPVPTTTVQHIYHPHLSHHITKEKHMVKLRPMIKPGHTFQPFMAVP